MKTLALVKAVARIGGKPLAPKTDLLLLPVCGIIADMKPFVKVLAFCGLLIVIASCEAGKSGPFTFTNSTGEEVSVIITQDKTVEKKFSDQEKYVGEDYFSPTITFVKGIDSTDHKEIITAHKEAYREKTTASAAISKESQTGEPKIKSVISQTFHRFWGTASEGETSSAICLVMVSIEPIAATASSSDRPSSIRSSIISR